jgi:hypothetical protein
MSSNTGGGGRPGRGPIRQMEKRTDYKRPDFDGHELDGCDPDQGPYP